MSTTYKNQMEDSFTITKEFQASAHYGTGIEQLPLTATQTFAVAATLAAITGSVVTLTGSSAVTLTAVTAPIPVGQEFTLLNSMTAVLTITNTDGGAFDCGLESDYSTRSKLVLQPGQQVVLRGVGLSKTEMVSTTGDWE